ncbi:hypothetical protein Ddye_023346 [Dipteronia dyeriana]|uniref:Putative plant transposon protein domain-containing protein n=1 Tax=Dipteronia dyeriana TaxID=168575 RepID=A0AAD9WT58_9ROSI|nr:hypothetical protein Ddye_023346 [Dipteronia dyeriana]
MNQVFTRVVRRLEFFKRKAVLPERGINLEELRNTAVFHTVEHRGWETLVSNPTKYSWTLKAEFYAIMVPYYFQQYSTVMVRGVEVSLSIDDILDYYSSWLSEDQESFLRMRYGVTWNDIFIRQNVDFANSLVIQPLEFWVAPNFHIKHNNLEIELGLWNIFISHSIRPRRVGVEMGGERLDSPPESIGIATWTSLIVERDLTSDRRRTGKKKSSTRAESSRTHQEELEDMDFEQEL